jgi:hypothetical protein
MKDKRLSLKSDKAKKVLVRLMWFLLNQGRSLKTKLALPNGRAFFMCILHQSTRYKPNIDLYIFNMPIVLLINQKDEIHFPVKKKSKQISSIQNRATLSRRAGIRHLIAQRRPLRGRIKL